MALKTTRPQLDASKRWNEKNKHAKIILLKDPRLAVTAE